MGLKNNIKTVSSFILSIFTCAVLVVGSSHVSASVPYITERVSLTSTGGQMTTGNLQDPPILSQDGRYVAFSTNDPNVVAGDTNGVPDVFVRDRKLGTVVRANLTNTGAQIPSYSDFRMSANGRFVIFTSSYSGIVTGDTNAKRDLFIRDLANNTTEMVSLTSSGGLLNNNTYYFNISADGRYVVFTSTASNIVSGDTNGVSDLFVRDRKLMTTTLLSKSDSGVFGNAEAMTPSISCDGSKVTFISEATNLVSGDTNGYQDLFLVNRIGGDSISNITINANNYSNGYASISCNGETIAFFSNASNLVSSDTNSARDMFAYNTVDNVFERVNLDSSGDQANGDAQSALSNNIDFSGRYIVFESGASNLVTGGTSGQGDIFLRDVKDDTTQIVSRRSSSTSTTAGSHRPSISLDGRSVVYESWDTGLVSGDTNGIPDVFVSQTGI